jgi:hypothetical protein
MTNREVVQILTDIAAGITGGLLAYKAIFGNAETSALRMKLAKAGEEYCMRKATRWALAADQFARAYERARPVSV